MSASDKSSLINQKDECNCFSYFNKSKIFLREATLQAFFLFFLQLIAFA